MDPRLLMIELAEKIGLIAMAALVSFLVPPLRNRLLGVGRRRDKLAAVVLGLALSMWGAKLGMRVLGEHINVRAIGIFIAAILGGRKAGLAAGLGCGIFYVVDVDPSAAPWGFLASTTDGLLAGLVSHYAPKYFQGSRTFLTCCSIQIVEVLLLGAALLIVGDVSRYAPAWPAHALKIVLNAAAVTMFVMVARLVVAREEATVALVEAKAAADIASLEALRRRLEPHFLFNALNTLRATIRTNPELARELVSDLADLYRYLLSHPEDASLQAEVNHACAYLAIERARFGEGRLRVESSLAPDVSGIKVPALLLQPLVENAVKHGVAAHHRGGVVRVRAYKDEDFLNIDVENESIGVPLRSVQTGSGIALKTLRERLSKRFGEDASLKLEPIQGGMRARVRLPWKVLLALQTENPTTAAA